MYHEELSKVAVGEVTIHQATPKDLTQLAVLFDRYRIFYGKQSDVKGAIHFLSDRLSHAESLIFIAWHGPDMAGFTQLYPIFSSTRMKRYWLLNDLFVDEQFRAQGISVALIERVKEQCTQSGYCGFMLETMKSNVISNKLYKKTGLLLDQEHNYYSWEEC